MICAATPVSQLPLMPLQIMSDQKY